MLTLVPRLGLLLLNLLLERSEWRRYGSIISALLAIDYRILIEFNGSFTKNILIFMCLPQQRVRHKEEQPGGRGGHQPITAPPAASGGGVRSSQCKDCLKDPSIKSPARDWQTLQSRFIFYSLQNSFF